MTWRPEDSRGRIRLLADWALRLRALVGPAPEPVLFHSHRDGAVMFGAWAGVVALMLPFGLAALEPFLAGALTSLVLTAWSWRSFRFELTARTLTYSPNGLAPPVRLELAAIRQVQATDLLGRPAAARSPRRGHLLVRTDQQLLVVKSLQDPLEAARAIEILRHKAGAPDASGPVP